VSDVRTFRLKEDLHTIVCTPIELTTPETHILLCRSQISKTPRNLQMTDLILLLKQCSHQRPRSYRLYNFNYRLRNYNYDWPSSSKMWLPQIAHRQLHHLLHWLYQQLHKWIHSQIPSFKSIHHRLSQ